MILSSNNLFIKFIMATPTKSYSVANFISKLREFSPRFNVMNHSIHSSFQRLTALLAARIITGYTQISPFNVKYVVSPLHTVIKIMPSSRSLGLALLATIGFIRTFRRAKLLHTPLIREFIKHLLASVTVFINTTFAHQYEFIMNRKISQWER